MRAMSFLVVILASCTALRDDGMAASPIGSVAEQTFSQWAALASAQKISPAQPQTGDYVRDWTGPDGKAVKLVVKLPRPAAGAPDITVPVPAADADARPLLEAAIAKARATHAGRIVLTKGTYTFRSLPAGVNAHLLLRGLSDLTIEGNDATLVFTQNANGISIRESQRLRLHALNIDYALRTASLARTRVVGGRMSLVVDARYPVTADDRVYYASEFDPAAGAWVPGGRRAIVPPEAAAAKLVAPQTYVADAFDTLPENKTFVLFHHWYGGTAVKIDDQTGPAQAEDIVFDGVRIYSGPGMGFVAYGLKRGLAIVNCGVVPRPDGSSPISTEYDAVHTLIGGGDILITSNTFTAQGDDAINLNNPIHPITAVSADGRTLELSTYSRFMASGDTLGFFNPDGHYMGSAKLSAAPAPLGGITNRVALDRAVAGLNTQAVVRDFSLIASRFEVSGNVIERCNCHAVLAQQPNGRVVGNVIRNINRNAIRLLTDVSRWREGVGAINVVVSGNKISDTAIELQGGLPWAAITAYGGTTTGITTGLVNRQLRISGNTIKRALQGCITVANSAVVDVSGNVCDSSNLRNPGADSINVLNSTDVNLSGNKRTGISTGSIKVDAATTARVTVQTGY